jgi:acyl dehydratase
MDLQVGQRATRTLRVEPQMIESYALITGDRNPLHFDLEFAKTTRFERLIAQGGITTGLLHALVAMDLPGPGSVFVRQNWSFPAPVYIGDTLSAEAVVQSVRPGRGLVELSVEVRNQEGAVVLQGTALVFQDSGARGKN